MYRRLNSLSLFACLLVQSIPNVPTAPGPSRHTPVTPSTTTTASEGARCSPYSSPAGFSSISRLSDSLYLGRVSGPNARPWYATMRPAMLKIGITMRHDHPLPRCPVPWIAHVCSRCRGLKPRRRRYRLCTVCMGPQPGGASIVFFRVTDCLCSRTVRVLCSSSAAYTLLEFDVWRSSAMTFQTVLVPQRQQLNLPEVRLKPKCHPLCPPRQNGQCTWAQPEWVW